MEDVRDLLFQSIQDRRFCAVLTAERAGVLSGVEDAYRHAKAIGIELELCKKEGESMGHAERIGNLAGTPKQLAMAEESLIGTLAKASGIATAANTAMLLADGRVDIVCGSWKKMPPEIKRPVRAAIAAGGASFRITEPPMLYLDKNFIRMFGSIPAALAACEPFREHTRVVQLKGMDCPMEEETRQAIQGGAQILMVDTGVLDDLDRCARTACELGARSRVKIAFASGIRLRDIPGLCRREVDILCIGKEIVDAQLLDIRLDVIGEVQTWD